MKSMRLAGIVLFLATAASGGEFAVFAAGTRLHIDRHEVVDGATVRLYSGAGFTELNSAQVRGFEEDGVVPAGPVGPEPAPAPAANAAQDASNRISQARLSVAVDMN